MAALSGYEYSLDDSTYSNTLTFTQTNGEVDATTVYVRMVGTTTAPSGNIVLTSEGATNVNVAVTGTVSELPSLSVTEATQVFNLDEEITPVAIQNTLSGSEFFASYTNTTSGQLDGIDFTVSTLSSANVESLTLATVDWNNAGSKQGIIYDAATDTFTISFDSPVSNLNFYLFYFRGSNGGLGYDTYTFNHPFTVTHGLNGLPISGNTIDVSSTNYASGIIQFTEPVTTLTVVGVGGSNPGSAQGFTLSKSTPGSTYSVTPALPTGLTLDTATGEITGTPTVSSPATDYTVTGTTADGCTDTVVLSLAVNATPAIVDITDQTMCQNDELDVVTTITDTETTAGNLVVDATSSDQSILTDAGISITNSGDDFT